MRFHAPTEWQSVAAATSSTTPRSRLAKSVRRLTIVSGATPSSRPILMNRNELPQIAASARNITQVWASLERVLGRGAREGGDTRPPTGDRQGPTLLPRVPSLRGPLRPTARALIVVDVQNDFADPAGSLSVAGGEDVVPFINAQVEAALAAGAPVFYTQDWHPPSTPHFARDGGIWPVHCVAGTWGAELHPDLARRGPGRAQGLERRGWLQRLHACATARPARPCRPSSTACCARRACTASSSSASPPTTASRPPRSMLVPGTTRRPCSGGGIRAVELDAGDGERALERAAGGRRGRVERPMGLSRRCRRRTMPRRRCHAPTDAHGCRPRRGPRRPTPGTRLPAMTTTDDRPYSPGLQGVLAGETALSPRRRRQWPAALPRLRHRRARARGQLRPGRASALDRRVAALGAPALCPAGRPCRRRSARPA